MRGEKWRWPFCLGVNPIVDTSVSTILHGPKVSTKCHRTICIIIRLGLTSATSASYYTIMAIARVWISCSVDGALR